MTLDAETSLLDSLANLSQTGTSADVRKHLTPCKHKAEFPVASIVLRPEENYRWGSEQAMLADLSALDTTLPDGTPASSYATLRESIRATGTQDPVGVVQRDDGYHVIYGFTRVRAAQEVGLEHIRAYVYDSSIPEGEVAFLQLRENSAALRRKVNWVAETEQYSDIATRLLNRALDRMRADGIAERAPDAPKDQREISASRIAHETASRALGYHPSAMKSRVHWLRALDKRVIDLSRKGHFSVAAASCFHSNNVEQPYSTGTITAVLQVLHGQDGYKPVIDPAEVRMAIKAVLLKDRTGESPIPGGAYGAGLSSTRKAAPLVSANKVVRIARTLDAPVDDSGFEVEAGDDEAAKDDEAKAKPAKSSANHGPVTLMRGIDKNRQSPVELRDIAQLLAMKCLKDRGLGMRSDPAEVDKVIGDKEWCRIEGIGYGAGEVSMPPLMETVYGGRKASDPVVAKMQEQHDRMAERYVTCCFVAALVRMAFADAGIHDLDYSEAGWMRGKTTVDGAPVFHRNAHHKAIGAAVEKPGLTLLARAHEVWTALKPLIKKVRK